MNSTSELTSETEMNAVAKIAAAFLPVDEDGDDLTSPGTNRCIPSKRR